MFVNTRDGENMLKKSLVVKDPLFGRHPVLYGSVAVGRPHPFSDLDISIYTPQMPMREMLALEMSLALDIDKKLEGSPLSDVRLINTLPLVLAGKIITGGILIYCRGDDARVEYETSIRSAYFDFLPVIHNYQKTYLEQIAL